MQPSPTDLRQPQPAAATGTRRGPVMPRYGVDVPARPTVEGTQLLLVCLFLGWATVHGRTASSMLFPLAFFTSLGLGGSFLLDARHGIYNLVRTDVLMLTAIYGLLFVEFLFPQPEADRMIDPRTLKPGINAAVLAVACFAVGRHFVNTGRLASSRLFLQPVSPKFITVLFWFCCIMGFLHQWIAVSFNPVEWIDAMLGPRFSQPWSRDKYGDWKALLVEIGALLYLLPPLGAIMLARRQRYGLVTLLAVGAAVFMVFFTFFASGTRHQLIASGMMFVVSYAYFSQMKPRKFVSLIVGLGIAFLPVSQMMLTFRDRGLKSYFEMKKRGGVYAWEEKSFFVDYNMINLGNLIRVIPSRQPYLGLNVFYYALIRPIPRAVWKDKPDAGGAEINAALAEEGAFLTYSVTFIGEAWTCYGWWSVAAMSFLYGALGSWWNRFGTRRCSDLGIIIFASGLLTAVISIRSFNWVMVTILPTLFLLIVASWFLAEAAPRMIRKLGQRSGPAAHPS